MYAMLLVATPFILLQNFLQEAIGAISSSTVDLGAARLPVVPVSAALAALGAIILLRSYLTPLRVLAGLAALAMIALAQQVADYYFDHNFYDLQQNWHYFAYMIFAFMMYRDLSGRRQSKARIMQITFVCALLFSSFDEAFQLHMSGRVFDMGDIAKDVWGATTGVVLLYLGASDASTIRAHTKSLRSLRPREYWDHPFGSLVLLVVLSGLLLCFSSLLSDAVYWWHVVVLTGAAFSLVYLLLHTAQYRWFQYGLMALVSLTVIVQGYFYFEYRSEYIVHNRYGLTVYKGIPLPYFDVLFFPDGGFRLVDKKHYFSFRDQTFLMKQKADILLIGSGVQGRGGNGLPGKSVNQFVFNRHLLRGMQVIILRTPEACQVFNRLKREGKSVLFVLHNTC